MARVWTAAVSTRYGRSMGDDACWMDRTCLACGRFLESDHVNDERCPHCGAERALAPAYPPEGESASD